MQRDELISLLKELFGADIKEINDFNITFILASKDVTLDRIRNSFDTLIQLGLSKEKIATLAQLLGRDSETLFRNATFLQRELGLSKEKIATNAALLGRDSETLLRNATFLQEKLGLSKEKIATNAALLGQDSETLVRNATFLQRELGLSKEKIATLAQLLGRDSETLLVNATFLQEKLGLSKEKIASRAELLGRDPKELLKRYQRYVALLREQNKDSLDSLTDPNARDLMELHNLTPEIAIKIAKGSTKTRNELNEILKLIKIKGFEDEEGLTTEQKSELFKRKIEVIRAVKSYAMQRNSGREILQKMAPYNLAEDTFIGNYQYLKDKDIDYNRKNTLLSSSANSKREKMAWILRNIMDYQNLNNEQKKEAIRRVIQYFRDTPGDLSKGIKTMEKEEFRKKAQKRLRTNEFI